MKEEKFNEKGYPDRKPDKETESFKMWTVDSKEIPKEIKKENYPILKYEGIEIGLGGFDIIYDRNIKEPDKKIMVAIKFKEDIKNILYYLKSSIIT